MITARDLMTRPAPTTPLETAVPTIARRLMKERLDGLCVVDDSGHLAGVITAMDLIFQEQPVHLPSFVVFLDAVIPLERPGPVDEAFTKLAGALAADIMTTEVITVTPDTPLGTLARRMVKEHLSVLPVIDGDTLVGMVDRHAMLTAVAD